MKATKNFYFVSCFFFIIMVFAHINRYDHGWNGEHTGRGENLAFAIFSAFASGALLVLGLLKIDEKESDDADVQDPR